MKNFTELKGVEALCFLLKWNGVIYDNHVYESTFMFQPMHVFVPERKFQQKNY